MKPGGAWVQVLWGIVDYILSEVKKTLEKCNIFPTIVYGEKVA